MFTRLKNFFETIFGVRKVEVEKHQVLFALTFHYFSIILRNLRPVTIIRIKIDLNCSCLRYKPIFIF